MLALKGNQSSLLTDIQPLFELAYSAAEFDFIHVLTVRRQLAQATTKIDGLLLSGGLSGTIDTSEDGSLIGQAISGQ